MKQITHIRRCHVCGGINESVGQLVSKCEKCGKHFAPFYFFNEKRALGIPENVNNDQVRARTVALPYSEYPPLLGLTASWDEIS